MARATGSGKVQMLPIPPAEPTMTLRASLLNFDIDGDTPKSEHERFLVDNVVPLLEIPGVVVRLRGVASRSGSDAHNLALSQRRVDKVQAFLRRHGPANVQVDRQAVGEADAAAAGQADRTEDEAFRAVIVSVVNLLGLRPVRFERALNLGLNDGFDDSISPRWLMLPMEETFRQMQVVNADGLALVSSNDRIALPQPALFRQAGPVRITRQTQVFRVFTGMPGDAEIRAVDSGGRVRGRLLVSVLPQLTVKCAFHHISNPRYGTRTRRPGDERDLLRLLDEIWDPQANIRFEQVASNIGRPPIVMTDRLGAEINAANNAAPDWIAVIRHRDRNAQFNVFLVREFETDREGTLDAAGNLTDSADAGTVFGECIFEDDISGSRPETAGVALAHEAGHALTLDHDSPIRSTIDMVMFATTAGGRFLPRAHVLPARRNVRRS